MSFDIGHAHVLMVKSAAGGKPATTHSLSGELYLSKSGWLLLQVPNALVRGAFAALNEPGVELPPDGPDSGLNAHISVIRPEELEEAGVSADDISERGKQFSYTLGPVQSVTPNGWAEMSKVWFIKVNSPDLKKLRRTYGLTPLPKNNEFDFHITIAVRRKGILGTNQTRKAASLIHDGPMGWFQKLADEAEGIPSREDLGDLLKLKPGLVDFIIQRHLAEKAGPHYDVRFGTPETGLYSWATKHELPDPGQRRALFQQPLHRHEYGGFEGEIPEGYGKGTVSTHRRGKIMVTHMSDDKIEFTTADKRHPERFVLLKPQKWGQKDWLLINRTPTEALPYNKVHYKKIPGDQIEKAIEGMQEGETVERKIDGASSLVKLLENGAELTSYRTSKETGRPIVHTERFFGGPGKMKIPPELVGTVLKGELYGQRDGEVVPPQELGGILNASLAESMRKQKDQNVTLRNMLYDIQQLGNEPVDWHQTPRAERRKMIEQVLQHMPADKFHLSEAATTPEEAKKLWGGIKEKGYSPYTEGVVYWPLHGTPSKSKLTEDQDVYITGTFPGNNRLAGSGIGGFTYSLSPGGPTVGRVGTGLSEELRQDVFNDPESYVGRVARVRAQNQFPSGAYRAPALIGMHEDYPNVKEAMAPQEGSLIHGGDISGYFSERWADLCGRQADLCHRGSGRDFRESGAESALERQASWDPHGVHQRKVAGAADNGQDAEQDQGNPADVPGTQAAAAAEQPNNDILMLLQRAKAESNRRNYAAKYGLLRQMMRDNPGDFVVDSPVGKYHGITHAPTGFQYHVPQMVYDDLVKESSLGYAVRDSSIHGKGTFATRNYEPGDRVGLALQYSHTDDKDQKIFDRTVLGRYVNYQPEGNVVLRPDDNGNLDLYASKPIAMDEEMYTQPYDDELAAFGPLVINEGYKQAFDMSGSWYGGAAQDYLNNLLAGRGNLWDTSKGIWGNIQRHLGGIRNLASSRINQAQNFERFQSAMDPGYALQRFQGYLSGRQRPIIQHPVDAILHGRYGQ